MPLRRFPVVALLLAAMVTLAKPALAQKPATSKADSGTAALVGTWTGTVTVPLGDSSIVAPVMYTFVAGPGGLGGTAMVPGQGNGTISNVVRTGTRVQFRVTVAGTTPPGATPTAPKRLEHDATLGAVGTLEGMVNLDGLPVAKFKVMAKR